MRRFAASDKALLSLLYPFCLVGALALAPSASAETCQTYSSYPPNSDTHKTYTVPTSITINPSDRVNTVLFSATISFPSMTVAECGPRTVGLDFEPSSLTISGDGVFSTGYPSIGLRIYRNGTQLRSLRTTTTIGPGRGTVAATTYRFEYIKLSQPDASFRMDPVWARAVFGLPAGRIAIVHRITPDGSVSVTAARPTCTVSTSNVTIQLGDVAASSMSSVGAVSPTSATQNVSLSCSHTPSVTMTMSGTRASPTLNNVLALTSASTARGVGVQILRGGTPLTIGSGVLVSPGAGAALTVPIAARYYRTGDITAGSANAMATLGFTYN